MANEPDGPAMQQQIVASAIDAALDVARAAGLAVDGCPPARLPGAANVVVGFRDAGIVAKVATRPQAMATLPMEHALALELADLGAPASRPVDATTPTTHAATGFLVTLWQYVDHDPTAVAGEVAIASSLGALHEALAATSTPLPSFLDEVLRARTAVADDEFMAALSRADRDFLDGVFAEGLAALADLGYSDRRLHGEPHEANRLVTSRGVVWVDFESCATGPLEWDLAFFSPAVVESYRTPVDRELLACLDDLNRARFAAWRWGISRNRPEFRALAEDDLAYLKSR